MSSEVWYVIVSVVATLIVQAAHSRGIRLPLLESVLDWIGRTRMPLPPLREVRLPSPGNTVRPELTQAPDGAWVLEWRETSK